jgi:hypothetical protein
MLDWRSRSIARKCQIIGAAAGGAMTAAVHILLVIDDVSGHPSGWHAINVLRGLMVFLWFLFTVPATILARAVGWRWDWHYGLSAPELLQASTMVLVNAALFYSAATLVGFLLP